MSASTIKIRIPADIDVEFTMNIDNITGEETTKIVPMTFEKNFIRRTVFNQGEQRWGSDSQWLFAGMEIRGAFKDKVAGDVVELSRDQWEKLKSVVEKPQNAYNFEVMAQLRPFITAILDAKERLPEEENEKKSKK
jgi:hypothetical protein